MYTPTPSTKSFSLADRPLMIQSKKIPTYRERIGFTGGDQEPCRLDLGSSLLDWLPGANRWPVLLPTASTLRRYAVAVHVSVSHAYM